MKVIVMIAFSFYIFSHAAILLVFLLRLCLSYLKVVCILISHFSSVLTTWLLICIRDVGIFICDWYIINIVDFSNLESVIMILS